MSDAKRFIGNQGGMRQGEQAATELAKKVRAFVFEWIHLISKDMPWDGLDSKLAQLLSDALRKEGERVRELAAQVVDQCNREGPYNAICAAERIREMSLASQQGAKP